MLEPKKSKSGENKHNISKKGCSLMTSVDSDSTEESAASASEEALSEKRGRFFDEVLPVRDERA